MDAPSEETSERFVGVSDDETGLFLESMKNPNTKRKTASDFAILKEWLVANNELRQPEAIEKKDLDMYLARFWLSVRSKKKEDYEPDTLRSIQASINRHLQETVKINIMTDLEFKHSRDVLAAKMKELKSKGLGNKKRKADPFTKDEIDLLYRKNLLGPGNPQALVNTVWLNNCLHFGMRSRQEHLDLMWGDVEMKCTTAGEQYLEFNERETKTRKGQKGNTRKFAPKMFALPDDPRCPIRAFKEFIRRRPDSCVHPDSRFYLSLKHNVTPDSKVWYTAQAMGKNTLGNLVKRMAEEGDLSGRKVNHSARKTTVTSLLHSNVETTNIMQLTGHKNVASINEYGTASVEQQKNMSNILAEVASGGNKTRQSLDNQSAHNNGSPEECIDNNNNSLTKIVQESLDDTDDFDLANFEYEEIVQNLNTNTNITKERETILNIQNPAQNELSKFCILPYATGNVTINIYGNH